MAGGDQLRSCWKTQGLRQLIRALPVGIEDGDRQDRLSLDDLVIASFTTGPGATTLPIRIYSEVRLGVKPEINAICTIMIAIVALGTIISSLITKRGASRRERAALAAQV